MTRWSRHDAPEPEDLDQAAATWSGRGAKFAVEGAARYVRNGVDSVHETRLRMLLVLAGLPEPTVNLDHAHSKPGIGNGASICAIPSSN